MATHSALLFPCGCCMALSRSAVASGFPTGESVHAAVGGDSNIAAVAVVAVAIAITTVEEGSATNSTA